MRQMHNTDQSNPISHIYIMINRIQYGIQILDNYPKIHMIQQKISQGHQPRSTARPKTDSFPHGLVVVMVVEPVSCLAVVPHSLISMSSLSSMIVHVRVTPYLYMQHSSRLPMYHDPLKLNAQHLSPCGSPFHVPAHQ